MALFASHWQALLFAIGLSVITIILAVFGGGIIDDFYNRALELPGHDSDFATSTEGTTNWFINAYYTSLAVIFLFGWAVYAQSVFAKASSSRYM